MTTFTVTKWKKSRFWALLGPEGALICVCVYRKGARALKERLEKESGVSA